jgi:hypothetical protein
MAFPRRGAKKARSPSEDNEDRPLVESGSFENIKSACYKTVALFSGLTVRKLWLKNGSSPRTDGHEIEVSFDDPAVYRQIEHLLGHILFRTDVKARDLFVSEYSRRVADVAKKNGVFIDVADLVESIRHMVNVLESHRVNSLWSLLYEGSAEDMASISRVRCAPLAEHSQESLAAYFTCVANGVAPLPGELDVFRPYFVEALSKVERRGFVSTLATAKWLVTCLVTEMLHQKDPPPPTPDSGGENNGWEGESDQEGSTPAEQPGGSSDGSEQEDEADTEEPFQPPEPPPGTTTKDRADALKSLMDKMGSVPQSVADQMDPVKESKYAKHGAGQQSQRQADQALRTDVTSEQLDQLLDASASDMEQVTEAAKNALKQQFHEDEWLQQDAMAKVVFHNVSKTEAIAYREGMDRYDLLQSGEDEVTIQRLRALFFRVMGRRRSALTDSGTEIDVGAYLAGKISGVMEPCFKVEERGQGFKAMILLDQSGSMRGDKATQVQRACRVITKALKFPFVEVQVWGFQSRESGQIDVTRWASGVDSFVLPESQTGGCTPLHIATRLASRSLDRGKETKRMFVLTDGMPVHARRDGRQMSTRQLMALTRKEVNEARQSGVGVTGILIGDETRPGVTRYDMRDADLKYMFGPSSNWRKISGSTLGSDLVKVVSTSFVSYLNNR